MSFAGKIYAQPLGILRGCVANRAVESAQARWLAGGPQAFTMVRLIFRAPGRGQADVLIPVVSLDDHMAHFNVLQQAKISDLMDRITAVRGTAILQGAGPLLQGIVNVTPDSFSDGGQYHTRDQAIAHARALVRAGADIIDIGGESTRPGAAVVSVAEELDRVIPVIEGLADIGVPLSIDTRNQQVMAQALQAGAHIINDVSALGHDRRSLDFVAGQDGPVILMHAQNNPENMQNDPCYGDVVLEVYDYLEDRLTACEKAGLSRDRLIIDPGIGFGKTVAHNLDLLAHLGLFHGLGVPLLLGVSRKSFMAAIGGKNTDDRLAASLAFGQMGYAQGVQILRVHDVVESRQTRDSWLALAE